ncbi:MAG: Stp1/IreP family PP2C-type Ser/Thr phosphatase [Clostridia bacterium]
MISKVYKRSAKGLVRKKNEDSITVFSFESQDRNWHCLAVADGVGGHNAGDLASSIVVENLEEVILSDIDKFEISDLIQGSIKEINQIIYKKSLESDAYQGMGTTVTMALISEGNLYIGHVGDSRAYLLRDNQLSLLTQDHSIVGELVKSGKITKEEAMNHPRKNIILQAVGLENNLKVDFLHKKLIDQDLIILCTDGFSDLVSDQEIEKIFSENEDEAIDILTRLVLDRGARDNYSIIAAKWVNGDGENAID